MPRVFLAIHEKGRLTMRRLWLVCGVVAAIGCGGGGGGGGTGGTTGAGGAGACSRGNEGCDCYPNGTCNGSLTCLSNLCVSLTGTAGTGGSAAGSAGTTGSGGSTAGTGGSATGTAGTTGSGGSGPGGTTGSGGTGACTTGNEGCACYGNGTCNGSLACLSQLCVSLTGTGGRGGTTGTAGTGGAGGGTAGTTGTGGRGGTTGTAGTGGSASNGALQFTAGVVTAGSNTFGITGGVYTFSDGVGSMITPNCATDDCFGSVTGGGPICVSGIGTRVLLNASATDYDYATYWGAAMALDLNNPTNAPNAQLAYKASDYGVKGFQFTFQNRASSVVRLTFKVRDAGGTLVDYCLDLGTATSIIHFSDARQQCYALVPGPALTAALADRVEALQWQVPTTPAGAVSFDYCISNLIPLLQ